MMPFTVARDKALHFGVGLCIGIGAPLLLRHFGMTGWPNLLWTWTSGLAISAGKEIYDRVSRTGTPEFLDFVYTVAGLAAGMLIAYTCY